MTSFVPNLDSLGYWYRVSLYMPPPLALKAFLKYWHQSQISAIWGASVNIGTPAMTAEVARTVKDCPTTQVVLAGYSQGGMVAHRAQNALVMNQPRYLPNIMATVLIADGDRVSNTVANRYGSGSSTRNSGVQGTWTPMDTSASRAGRTFDMCLSQDLVCDFRPDYLLPTATGGKTFDARKNNFYSRHTQQYVPDPALAKMATDLAALYTSPPPGGGQGTGGQSTSLTIETAALPDVFAGQKYDVQMTASGGKQPQVWSYSGDMPRGLSLTASGRIVGTPTETYGTKIDVYLRDSGGAVAVKTFGINQQGPVMDSLCRSLGLGTEAWLPGQVRASDYSTRIISAPDAAYSWSCTRGGAHLTADQISADCSRYGPGLRAITSNRDNAYSWLCRKG